MAHLHRIGLNEILMDMPPVVPMKEALAEVGDIDALITVSGFEPRVTGVAEQLAGSGHVVGRACYLAYNDDQDGNVTRDRLLLLLRSITDNIESLAADAQEDDFYTGLRDIVEASARVDGEPPLVILDISAASSRLLVRCVHALLHSDIRLLIAYSQADMYYPTFEEYESWKKESDEAREQATVVLDVDEPFVSGASPDTSLGLDHGAKEVDFVSDFRVQQLETLPDRVIIFPAFNGQRGRMFLAHLDPGLLDNHPNDAVSWLVGVPLRDEDKWRFKALAAANSLLDDNDDISDRVTDVTTFDYIDVMRKLGAEYEKNFGREKVTICAMGSKMQNLASVLFCEMHPDVRLGQALPERYANHRYSEGVAEVWAVNFGSTSALRDLFNSYGTVQILDD